MENLPLQWQFNHFNDLSTRDLYAILQARQQCFVVDIRNANLDADGIDTESYHLSAWSGEATQRRLVAYLRLVPPGVVYAEPSIGRVLSVPEFRGKGYGVLVMREGLHRAEFLFPDLPIRISAQTEYETFYLQFGFGRVSEEYMEVEIPHVQMLLSKPQELPRM